MCVCVLAGVSRSSPVCVSRSSPVPASSCAAGSAVLSSVLSRFRMLPLLLCLVPPPPSTSLSTSLSTSPKPRPTPHSHLPTYLPVYLCLSRFLALLSAGQGRQQTAAARPCCDPETGQPGRLTEDRRKDPETGACTLAQQANSRAGIRQTRARRMLRVYLRGGTPRYTRRGGTMLGAYTLRGDSCLRVYAPSIHWESVPPLYLRGRTPRRLVSLSKAPRLPFKGVSSDSRRLARRRRDRSHGTFSTELKDDWRVVGRAA